MKTNSNLKLKVVSARIRQFSLIAVCLYALGASAQSFSSGSDGSDGPLDATSLGVTPTNMNIVFNPTSFPGDQHNLNIFNFTTIDIPAGVTLRFSSTKINGPVYFLASGAADVEGTIDLSGQAGVAASPILDGRRRAVDAGAGGYDGGVGGKSDGSTTSTNEPLAQPGDGPGGGKAGTYSGPQVGTGGSFSGNSFLVPLVGGSGGGGGLFQGALGPTIYGASGGAGGGALLVASSGTITVNGTINANGGPGGAGGTSGCCYYAFGYGGGGSGGGIRLAANTVTGSGTITNVGGNTPSGTNGGNGVVRIEAFTDTFTGTVTGTETMAEPVATYVPTTAPPTVSVVNVNSTNLPASPTGSLATPDATIDTASAVTITVQTSNIPVGTVLTLHVFSDNNTDQAVKTTPLAGTLASATATASVTFPSGYALNYVKATWTPSN
jgi:hypothetical protein